MKSNEVNTLTTFVSATEHLVVKDTEHGKGIFAAHDLSENTLLTGIQGPVVSFQETTKMGERESYCLQVGINKYIKPEFPFYLFNHSCNPNCGIKSGRELVTINPVQKGEELRWDYSTSMLERGWELECSCKEDVCRGVIRDFDLVAPSLQNFYTRLKIVMPFITEKLAIQNIV